MSNTLNSKIKKALKMYNLILRPTGNTHADELAKRTYENYIKRHNIDESIIMGFGNIEVGHQFLNPHIAELFLMISIKEAEERDMLNDYTMKLDQKGGVVYSGPKFFYDLILPIFKRYERKYEITSQSVQKRLENFNPFDAYRVIGLNGSSITILGGNIATQNVKYSERAFYNAFLIKYDLIAKVVIDKMQQQQESNPVDEQTSKDVHQLFHMFHKESINEQLDEKGS